MLGGRFCTESACVPEASEDVRVCCWLNLGDEAEQHETKSSVHCTLQLMNVAGQSAMEECIGVGKTRLDNRRGDSDGDGVSECRSDVSERPVYGNGCCRPNTVS